MEFDKRGKALIIRQKKITSNPSPSATSLLKSNSLKLDDRFSSSRLVQSAAENVRQRAQQELQKRTLFTHEDDLRSHARQ